MKAWACLAVGVAVGLLWSKQVPDKPSIIQSKLTNIVLSTTNMDKEIQFFEETLGFKPFFRNETSCFFKTGGSNLVLVKVASRKATTKQICIDVSVPNLSDALKAMQDAKIPVDASNPAILKLKDPDGNLIEVVKG